MGRFFFNIQDGGEIVDDPDGQECASVTAARAAAVAGLRELIASDVRDGVLNTALAIEIANEARERVGAVTFGDVVAVKAENEAG